MISPKTLRRIAQRKVNKSALRTRLNCARKAEVPFGFRAISAKLTSFEIASEKLNIPLRNREYLAKRGLLLQPVVNPVIDSHYFYTITKIFREKIARQPDSAAHLIRDLAGSKLLRRMNIVLAKNGVPPITQREIGKILLGQYQPPGMPARVDLIAKRLEELGKRDEGLKRDSESMWGNVMKMKQDILEEPFNIDRFIHAVETGYLVEGESISEQVKQLTPNWRFEKEFFCDIYANKLKI